ncbi:MAG TPA: hypothetical protein VF059_04920 [Casimicrobiaceae bacterium]
MLEFTRSRIGGRMLAGAFAAWSNGRGGSLVGLPWFPFPVAVSASERTAGERIAQRAQAARKLLGDVLGAAPKLSLVVLARDDWDRHARIPSYGVTHVGPDGELIVGAEPADAWHAVSDYLARRLSPRACAELAGVHGVDATNGRGPALEALAERLIAHEIAHLAATQAGIEFPRRWLEEAFANLALVAVLGETDPAGLRLVGSLAEAAATLDDDMPSLAGFEAEFGQMDVVPSVLAELAITRGAYAAYAAGHTAPLARLFAALRDHRLARDADYELGRMLAARVHPALAAIPARFASSRAVGLAA